VASNHWTWKVAAMTTCSQPALNQRIADLCFDLEEGEERTALEAHLLVCDACWTEFQRVSDAVSVLRSEKTRLEPVVAADMIQLVGLGGRLHYRLGGHVAIVGTISAAYGLMMALALLAEVAYRWDVYGRWAPTVSFVIGVTSAALCFVSFDMARRRLIAGRTNSIVSALVPLFAWAVLVAVAVAPFLSSAPIVLARFQTMTGRLGWIKSVAQALEVPLLSLVPFHFVLSMQYELWSNRVARVLRLLTNDPMRVTPRGTLFIQPLLVGAVFVLFAGWWIVGTAHLLENLQPGPYFTLFMAVAMSRMMVVLLSLLTVLIWYTRILNDLKREVIAISAGRRVLDTD
jgi:hypothetical protein